MFLSHFSDVLVSPNVYCICHCQYGVKAITTTNGRERKKGLTLLCTQLLNKLLLPLMLSMPIAGIVHTHEKNELAHKEAYSHKNAHAHDTHARMRPPVSAKQQFAFSRFSIESPEAAQRRPAGRFVLLTLTASLSVSCVSVCIVCLYWTIMGLRCGSVLDCDGSTL